MPSVILFFFIIIVVALGAFFVARKPGSPPPPAPPTSTNEAPAPTTTVDTTLFGEAGIRLDEYPTEVSANSYAAVKWTVTVPERGTVSHTTIHYDTSSHAGSLGLATTPALAGYASLLADYASGTFAVPASFTGNLLAPATAGTLYLRAHATIDGKHYWTDEVSILVTGNQ